MSASVVSAVREIMSRMAGIEEDRTVDGVTTIIGSLRDSAADDEPSPRVWAAARVVRQMLRAVSPMVYVEIEDVDEWIVIRAVVRGEVSTQ